MIWRRCESDGMAVVWNGYETGKKIYKTHPDGLPAQYNAFRHVRHVHASHGNYSAMTTRVVIYRKLPNGFYSMLNPLGTDRFNQSHSASSLTRTPKATIDAMEGFGAYLYRVVQLNLTLEIEVQGGKVTVTGLLKVTAIFSNCNVTELHL